ncbi:zinc finger protein ZAT12-like [Amaranthus tricolor]|uniref:zinc finger protein ZAT12-like n=1 Tax=Amaranthus tricolor TaxID=29722 RepID=UPI002589CAC0|nr:zinc finger protein ZAT12-like [Amaranthus tricolor]
MGIKRNREDLGLERTIAMANYLIFLSQPQNPVLVGPTRVYECKTCNRQFPSFQALGGHRASHKKPRTLMGDDDLDHHHMMEDNRMDEIATSRMSKIHACSICGLESSIGQALGGHMRRHTAALTGSSLIPNLSCVTKNKMDHHTDDHNKSRFVCLDLNLTPSENGLLEIGQFTPIVC